MKKRLLLVTPLILTSLLASCSSVKAFEWWDTENITIVKSILEKDAVEAYESSLQSRSELTSKKTSLTINTYYKDYLGNFATEIDGNITESRTIFEDRYSNDVTIFLTKYTREESYKQAHTNGVVTIDNYHVGEASEKTILERVITDYGYGSKIGTEKIYHYPTSEEYTAGLYISTPSIDSWANTTYGLAKNDDVLVEKISSTNVTYHVNFSGLDITECVRNNYELFRFKRAADNRFILDYYHHIESLQIGKDCLGNQLNEPFTLEKTEIVSAFYTKAMTAYDKTLIPVIPD